MVVALPVAAEAWAARVLGAEVSHHVAVAEALSVEAAALHHRRHR